MNHEDVLEAIRLRSRIEKLDVDVVTREKLLAGMPDPKGIPWDLVSETIKAREEAMFKDSLLDNMVEYYKKAVLLAEYKLEEAMELRESLFEDKENIVFEEWVK